jgi:hypothetical protein
MVNPSKKYMKLRPINFECDISVDYQYGTQEQSLMERVDDDPLLETIMISYASMHMVYTSYLTLYLLYGY